MTDINKDFLDLTGLTFGIDKWLNHKVEGDYDANVKLAKFILWHMPAGALFTSNDKEESKWHDLKMQLVTDMCDTLDVDIHDVIDDGGDTPVEDRYLTFTSTGASTLGMGRETIGEQFLQISLEYCLNGGDWTTFVPIETTIEMQDSDIVKMRGNNTGFYQISGKSVDRFYFTMTGSIAASGDITSILNNEGGDCELSEYCYYYMFQNCTSLTTSPVLPATTLANSCYSNMFKGCTSLTTAPELSATTLANHCYSNMFSDCSSLTTAPSILPATTLDESCYTQMFRNCTSLTTAPELPSTQLADNCYSGMFQGCTSLTTAPELPAETLAVNCYYYMFNGCTSLTTSPVLPATTLANSCYSNMFNGCTSLTTSPVLPATTLANSCYRDMFNGCTSLTQAPNLPATQLAPNCYGYMFRGCTSLNTVTCLATTGINENGSTYYWLYEVSKDGTFTRAEGIVWPEGVNGIPSNWTIEPPYPHYLTFTNNDKDKNDATISLEGGYYGYGHSSDLNLEYSIDGNNWNRFSVNETIITLRPGESVKMRGLNTCISAPYNSIGFVMEGKSISASGHVTSLLNGIGGDCQLSDYCFYELFAFCTSLTEAPELPSTNLANNCYRNMFYGCTSLTEAPELPATQLTSGCYYNMFSGCTSLNTVTCLATTGINEDGSTSYWLYNVSATGTFTKADGVVWPSGDNGIPTNWTVKGH